MMLLRRILFILFCLAYVIFCPLIILNTLGIVISPQHRQNIVKTGLVYLSTLPPGARVYLSRYRYPQKTPTMIRNLPPGQYSLKVELKNYRPWQKIVSVEKEKATVLENIILIPERWDARLLDLRAFETLLPVANGSLFLIRQGPLLKDCTIFRATSGKPEPAMPPQAGVPDGTALIPLTVSHSPYGDAKILSLVTARDSSCLLAHAVYKGQEHFLWFDLKPKPPVMRDVSNLFLQKPDGISWDPEDPQNIFLSEGSILHRLDISTSAVFPKLAEGIRGFGLFRQRIYALTENNEFIKMDFEGTAQDIILRDTRPVFGDIEKDVRFDIHVLADDVIVMLGEKGELLSNRLPYRLEETGVRGFAFDAPTKRLAFWTDRKIGLVEFSRPSAEKLFDKELWVTWLEINGKNIEQAFWVNRGDYLLYRDQDKIFLREIKTSGAPLTQELLTVKRNSAVVFSETNGRLYYLDDRDHTLMSIQLVPPYELFSFPRSGEKNHGAGTEPLPEEGP